MEPVELLLEEYKSAKETYKFYRDAKYKILNIFLTIITLILTFTIKQDLPEETYLLVSIIIIVSAIYYLSINHRHLCASNSLEISEIKLNYYVESSINIKHKVFDLIPRRAILSHGQTPKKSKIKITLNIFLVLIAIFLFHFLDYRGVQAINCDRVWKIIIYFFFISLLFLLYFLSISQNNQRKKRFIKLKEDLKNSFELKENTTKN